MHIIDLIFDFVVNAKNDEDLGESQMLEKIIPFKKALLVWGSPDTIEAWSQFEVVSGKNPTNETIVKEMEILLRAIRKDLGHDDSKLQFGSILALLIVAEDKEMLFSKIQE